MATFKGMDLESDSALAGKKKKPTTPRAKKADTETKPKTSPAVNGAKKSPTKTNKSSETTKKSPKIPVSLAVVFWLFASSW